MGESSITDASLPPDWSKFMTDVKLVKDLHTTNFDQIHAYLEQHELHANEVCLLRERNQDSLAFVANQQMKPPYFNTYQSSYNNPQLQQQFSPSQYRSIHPTQPYSSSYPSQLQLNHSSVPQSYPCFNVPVFSLRDDLIACLNKAMAFLTTVASLRGDKGKVILVLGHMARQCTQPKRPRNATWYKEKSMLAEAQEARQILDEEQLAFLADPGVPDGQAIQTIIPNNPAFQTEDLDTYDSDCDNISNAKAVLMTNISNYGSDVISEEKLAPKEQVDSLEQNYEKLNRLSDDFGKRFTPQQELLAEQAFWLHMSNPTSKPFDASSVKIEAPKELLKVSLVNESLKKLKFHLARFNKVVKIRTPDAHTKGEWGFEHTKAVFNNEIIPFLKSLKYIFNVFDRDLLNEIMEVFKEHFDSIKKTRVRTKEQSDSLIDKLNLKSTENEDLKAQIQDKVFVITSLKNDLQKIKGKEIVDIAAQIPSASTIVLRMFKLDLEPLAPRLLQNREMHIEYLKYTQEQADIPWEIVKQAKAKQPLDKELDFA
ncbi:hypothetical protein Tco_1364025, partial [Tanacetum coccineum]